MGLTWAGPTLQYILLTYNIQAARMETSVSTPVLVAILAIVMIIMHMATMATLMFKDHVMRFMDGIATEEIYMELQRRRLSQRSLHHYALPDFTANVEERPVIRERPEQRRQPLQQPRHEEQQQLHRPYPKPPTIKKSDPVPLYDDFSMPMTPCDAYQQSIDSIQGHPFGPDEGFGKPQGAYQEGSFASPGFPSCKNFNTFNF